jgi:ATP-dependent protease ClpP protease subunit
MNILRKQTMVDHIDLEGLEELPLSAAMWDKEVPYRFGQCAVVIEYLPGETRTKIRGGVTIETVFPVAYGRILGTTDVHGEETDVYIASFPHREAPVFIIDQVTPPGNEFDEHKVMFGFDSPEEVMHLYHEVFSDGSGEARLGAITQFTPESFVQWLTCEGASLKPAKCATLDNVSVMFESEAGVSTHGPKTDGHPARDESGGVFIELPDLTKGPKLSAVGNDQGGLDYHMYFYSGLDSAIWSNAIDAFCRTLELATDLDKVHIHIASPGGSVFLMGRMMSAMARTKALVITYAEGCVASAATSVWAAGHERHIQPTSFFMQHMSSQLLAGKTTDIVAKSVFCMTYIKKQLANLVKIGLFTEEEVADMAEKSADIYISGRTAIERVGAFSKAA